eukprot:6477454-Amphidinium_carterae.1
MREALCMGCNHFTNPMGFVALCGPEMLAADGRCFTFDQSASGLNFQLLDPTAASHISIELKHSRKSSLHRLLPAHGQTYRGYARGEAIDAMMLRCSNDDKVMR